MPPYEAEVRQFIVENFLFGEDAAGLSGHDSLLGKGLIDSTGILELVGFVQDRFGIRVEDDEIIPGNFDSIAKLAQFIQHKKGAASGQSDPGAGSDLREMA
jgi:acyl carrier protein